MNHVFIFLLAGLSGLVAHESAAPQVELRGILRDDLRGGAPVANAEVRLLGTGRVELTGPTGEFVFRAVPRGPAVVAHWAPWLDSLHLPPLRVEIEAAEASPTVILTTPTFAAYHQVRCGFAPREGESLLIGELKTTEATDDIAVVSASWTHLAVEGRTVEREIRATVDSLPAIGGGFALCGVPLGEPITLHVFGSAKAGPVLAVSHERLWIADLTAVAEGEAQRSVEARGRAINAAGAPVANAMVEIFGDSAPAVRTGSDGRFLLSVRDEGSKTLVVRSLGRQEALVTLHTAADSVDLGDIRLQDTPAALSPIIVEAERLERERQEFEARRQGANGYFITDEMLRGISQVSASTLASMIPRLGAERSSGQRRVLKLRRGMGFCSPRFFEDGLDVGKLDLVELIPQQWALIERAKRIEVYTANQAPPRFNDNDGCGSIVIWTK